MRLFLAAMIYNQLGRTGSFYKRLTDNGRMACDYAKNILESYHYVHSERSAKAIRDNLPKRIFLDSGAFSAFTMNVDIDIGEFCDYIKTNNDIIEMVSVLDAIGKGADGAEYTWRNQKEMERLGTAPLPCFHYGEPEKYLERYVAEYEYITLGGMVPISTPQLVMWLDRIWSKHIVDKYGHPKVKVHGFGLTSPLLMKRYPWYSVDSSSWLQIAAHGNIFHESFGMLGMSIESPKRKERGQHFDTLTSAEQQKIEALVEWHGFKIDDLREHHIHRRAFNILTFTLMGESIKDDALELKQPVLF